jgi:hypothetical protein
VPLPDDERKGPTPSATPEPSTTAAAETSTSGGSVSISISDTPSTTSQQSHVQQAPMAARLVWALCELLFRPYFTVAPPDVDAVDNGVFVARAWYLSIFGQLCHVHVTHVYLPY